MKLLKEGKYRVFEDDGKVIKVGPRDAIRWEADVLLKLKGIPGVPSVIDVSCIMGDSMDQLSLIMEKLPGEQLRIVGPGPYIQAIASDLQRILVSIFMANVCHLRVTPDHILIGPHGSVGLVGFSKAAMVTTVSGRNIGASPDLLGLINHSLVTLKSPYIPCVEGGYNHIMSYLEGRIEDETNHR